MTCPRASRRFVQRALGFALLALVGCEAKAAPGVVPAANATRSKPEATLGVSDRGIFSDLDAQLSLRLPAALDPARVHALFDSSRKLLVLYEGTWPLKVYPVQDGGSAALQLGSERIGLRPGDLAELAPLLAPHKLQRLAPGAAPPPGDRDADGIPDPLDVLLGAHKTALNRDRYDGRYERIAYPLGDVPREIGVCTDVVIRALRNAGLDLQREVHEDIARAPRAYPTVKQANTDIDHRRVKSLLPYFQRHFEPHAALASASDPYRPGDVVFMDTFSDRPGCEHVGIVSNELGPEGRPLIINNWTDGTVTSAMDLLRFVPVTERFRWPAPAHAGPIPARTTQLVLALSDGFSAFHARLQRYERAPGAPTFRRVGNAIPAVLGAAGYGWGDGLHGQGAPAGRVGPLKREGDMRSPAGAFALGRVHGYAAAGAVKLPYRQADADTRCVDDAASSHYNQVVSQREVPVTWRSAESMRRTDAMYVLALDIEHNKQPILPGHGSCIFAHVWGGPEQPVTGCTAMAERDLRRLLAWLQPDAIWVALPEPEYQALRGAWGLP